MCFAADSRDPLARYDSNVSWSLYVEHITVVSDAMPPTGGSARHCAAVDATHRATVETDETDKCTAAFALVIAILTSLFFVTKFALGL